jgi:hypothetical protein
MVVQTQHQHQLLVVLYTELARLTQLRLLARQVKY